MADSVIITGDQGQPDNAAFAAGVAAATAEQAEQTAEAAVAIAAEAVAVAQTVEAHAAEVAFDAQAAIAELRAEMVDGLDRVVTTVAEMIDIYTEEVDDGPAPAIVTTGDVKIEPHTGDPDKDKTPARGKGKKNDWWWGSR